MRISTFVRLAATMVILTSCTTAEPSQPGSHKYPTFHGVRQLSGEEAISLIAGKSVVGYYESNRESYVDFFAEDGRFASSGFDSNIYQGNWTIDRDRVCITVADEAPSPNRCITFIATNDQYVALRPGGRGPYLITGIRSRNFKNLPLE